MPRSDDDVEAPAAGPLFRDAIFSFCGGAGGPTSDAVGGVGAPSGPRGSSTASSFVDCVPYCRRRGPRAAGERGAAEALGAVLAAALFDVGESVLDSSWSCFGVSCTDCDEGTSATGSTSPREARARRQSYHPKGNHHRDPLWCDCCCAVEGQSGVPGTDAPQHHMSANQCGKARAK